MKTKNITLLLVVVFAGMTFLQACEFKPKVTIVDKKIESKIYTDEEGSPDAGYQIRYRLRNTGSAGVVKLKVRLITNEGSLDRESRVFLKKNEVQQVTFNFPEFTWTAHDAQVFEEVEF